MLARLSRAPAHHVERHRTRLHQILRELRAASRRAVAAGERANLSHAVALSRRSLAASAAGSRAALRARSDAAALERTSAAALERRRRDLDRILGTLAAHDPQRTLERGYALLEDPSGEPVTTAALAGALAALTVRLHDGRVVVRPDASTAEDGPSAPDRVAEPATPAAPGVPADRSFPRPPSPLPPMHRPPPTPRRRRIALRRPRPPPAARPVAQPTTSRASSATDAARASTYTT